MHLPQCKFFRKYHSVTEFSFLVANLVKKALGLFQLFYYYCSTLSKERRFQKSCLIKKREKAFESRLF
ncbi:MAG: hypothetical protein CSA20_03230 [Deltaproteobacteria bacterium]|nr:MAG: hypothetical protein CSA20_03230 [Deltaproteobacteria bacterium]